MKIICVAAFCSLATVTLVAQTKRAEVRTGVIFVRCREGGVPPTLFSAKVGTASTGYRTSCGEPVEFVSYDSGDARVGVETGDGTKGFLIFESTTSTLPDSLPRFADADSWSGASELRELVKAKGLPEWAQLGCGGSEMQNNFLLIGVLTGKTQDYFNGVGYAVISYVVDSLDGSNVVWMGRIEEIDNVKKKGTARLRLNLATGRASLYTKYEGEASFESNYKCYVVSPTD